MKNSELSGIIRSEIKKQYKSINKFAKAIGMARAHQWLQY